MSRGLRHLGLYRAFPDAFYHLVEPTRNRSPTWRGWPAASCSSIRLALGDHDGEALLEIRADIQGSTLLEEVGPRDFLRFDRVADRRFDRCSPNSTGRRCARSTCKAPS